MSFQSKKIYEYRGVEGLVAARVLQDDKEAYKTDEVFDIAGVAEIGKTTDNSTEAHYYDNMPAIVISSTGSDTITCTISALALDVLAELTGQTYDETIGAFIESKREQRYFALGYKTKTTDGREIYVWRYKGSFAIPDSTHSTENAGTDANGQTLTYTGISTTHKFTQGDSEVELRSLNVDTSLKLVDTSSFFDEVTTPDMLSVKTCSAPVARPSEGEIYTTDHIWLTCETEGAKIYYTTDGTDPDATKTLYNGTPFTLGASATVKAIAIADGYDNSKITSFVYTVKSSV